MPNPIDSLAYGQVAQTNVAAAAEGAAKATRAMRDGTLSVADWKVVMAMSGRLFQANVGTLVTPIAGHVAVTQLQPEGNVDVPVGTAALMLPPNIHIETSAGTLNRVLVASLNQAMGDGTSSAVTAGPVATRSDRQNGSAVRVRQAYTASGAAIAGAVSQVEHWRSGYAFADATGGPIKQFSPDAFSWPFPLLVGPASFQVYWGATTTAPSGWAELSWIEMPSNWVL